MFAFTRAEDAGAQALARSLGAEWAGDAMAPGPEPLDAALIFAPVGALVPAALRAVAPGGTVVCAGIHMSDIPSFPYRDLWEERVLRSVANLTRADARGVPRAGAAGAGAHDGHGVRARGGRDGAGAPARRGDRGRRGNPPVRARA